MSKLTESPVVVLAALAHARSYLAREGEYDREEAIDGVRLYAQALGVNALISEQIITEEFGARRP